MRRVESDEEARPIIPKDWVGKRVLVALPDWGFTGTLIDSDREFLLLENVVPTLQPNRRMPIVVIPWSAVHYLTEPFD